MITLKKMKKSQRPSLYHIALEAFQKEYETYGVYPPLLNTKNQTLTPPTCFGKVIYLDGKVIGGVFATGLFKKGIIGAIFIHPDYQYQGYGKQAMIEIEKAYPKVKSWQVETPAESLANHCFYENLGYVKTQEIIDEQSGMKGFVFEKIVKNKAITA